MQLFSTAVGQSSRLRSWIDRIFITSAGTGVELVLRFVRTLFLSHLLAPAEFGVTVALSVVIFTSELLTDIGLGPFVLNKADDAAGDVLATAHTLQILRGLILAIGIVAAAPFVAAFFAVPQFETSFRVVALPPLLRSFAHLGARRAQREYNYRPEALSTGISQAAALVAALVAGLLLRDHWAILVAFTAESLFYAVMTHRLSAEPFRIAIDARVGRQALAYGVPLLLSGLAGAVTAQADRMIVGHFFGVETLGVYGVIMTIAMMPMNSLFRIVSSIASAMLARDHGMARFDASYVLVAWGFTLIGVIYTAGLALGLDIVTPLVFGPSYKVTPPVHLLVSLVAFARILRWSGTLLLLALGATRQLAFANIVNGVGLMVGVLLVWMKPDLASVLIGVLVGEIVSLAMYQKVVVQRVASQAAAIRQTTLYGAGFGLLVSAAMLSAPDASLHARLMLAVVLAAPAAVAGFALLWSWRRRESAPAPAVA